MLKTQKLTCWKLKNLDDASSLKNLHAANSKTYMLETQIIYMLQAQNLHAGRSKM